MCMGACHTSSDKTELRMKSHFSNTELNNKLLFLNEINCAKCKWLKKFFIIELGSCFLVC